MGKRIPITAEIEKLIRHSIADESANVSSFAVFETRALSTEPISQSGFFDKSRVSRATLVEMAALFQKPGAAVPLIVMHQGRMLPIGRVVTAQTFDLPTGETELRSLFYLPANKEEMISDIENSVIDEVSVGLQTKHGFCSECKFDYFGEEATWENFVTMTCGNGHELGKDGVHVQMVGLDSWLELSLVGRGAAKDAKILSQGKQKLGQGGATKLAANGMPQHALLLNASFSMNGDDKIVKQPQPKEETMTDTNVVELSKGLASETAKNALLSKENGDLKATLAERDTALAAATKEIADLKAASGQATELVAAKDKAEAQVKELTEEMIPHVKAALAATGMKDEEIPAELPAMFKIVKDKGVMLHQLVGAGEGGKSKDDRNAGDNEASAELSRRKSFKLNKE